MKKLVLAAAALMFATAADFAPPDPKMEFGYNGPLRGAHNLLFAACDPNDLFRITAPAAATINLDINTGPKMVREPDKTAKLGSSEVNAPRDKVAKAMTGVDEITQIDQFAAKTQGIIRPADAGGGSLVITATSTSPAQKDATIGDPKVGISIIRAAAAPFDQSREAKDITPGVQAAIEHAIVDPDRLLV